MLISEIAVCHLCFTEIAGAKPSRKKTEASVCRVSEVNILILLRETNFKWHFTDDC